MKIKLGLNKAVTVDGMRYVSDSEGIVDVGDTVAKKIKSDYGVENKKLNKKKTRRLDVEVKENG